MLEEGDSCSASRVCQDGAVLSTSVRLAKCELVGEQMNSLCDAFRSKCRVQDSPMRSAWDCW